MKISQQTFITIFAILFLTGSFGCSNSKGDKNDDAPETSKTTLFDKLVGTWQSEDGKSFERWSKNADGNFTYVAFNVKGTDTSWNEHANIYPENDKWVFENTVKGQNDGKAVKFTSTILMDNTVQFSNPEHDFPTDINYTVIDVNTVHAFIIGPNDKGGKDTIPFNYSRLKQ